MLSRAAFVLIALFWLTMNVLLWRAEFGARGGGGVPVPAAVVWQRMLTAPDSSSLNIVRHGKKIGICRWITSIGEAWAEIGDENVPSGMPAKPTGYRVRLEGNALLEDITNRLHFEATLKLDQDRAWQEFDAHFGIRPLTWTIQSTAADGRVHLAGESSGEHFERVFKLSDLQNPAALVGEFLGPVASELIGAMELPAAPRNLNLDPGVKWEAFEDELRIGHSRARVYRLRTRVLDKYEATLWVSRVGEILRVELPDNLVLANDQLVGL